MTATDVDIVAALHTASWRRAYRGILTDRFLDTDLEGDRRQVWHEKLSSLASASDGIGWIAEVKHTPVGFVFVRPHDDATWGTLVDNLHVLSGAQGQGIGKRLLHTVGTWAQVHEATSPVHLWVFADNMAARGFYARVGGNEVEHMLREASDGRVLPEYRVAWASPTALVHATATPT